MSVKIYCDYEEFSYVEKEISEYFEEQSFQENSSYDEDSIWDKDSEEDILKESDTSIRDDARFYIVCENIDEEIGEDIAHYLGKFTKINLKELNKIFFYIV